MIRNTAYGRSSVLLVFLLMLFSLQHPLHADAAETEVGALGATFLRIPVGPRLMTSTEVVANMNPDASSAFSNPAGLSGIQSQQFYITAANWLSDMQLSAAGYVIPVPAFDMKIAFSTRLLYSGGLQGYNDALEVVTEDNFYNVAFSGAASKNFESIGLSLGLGITYVRERLVPLVGDGYTLSLGSIYRIGANSIHLHAKDIGGTIAFEGYSYPIDSRYVLGYGRMFRLPRGLLNVGAEFIISKSYSEQVQIGAEYNLNSYFTFRTALNQYIDPTTASNLPVSAGMGFHMRNMAVDYAFVPHSYFPATHMFSFTYSFGHMKATLEPGMEPVQDLAPVLPSSPASEEPEETEKLKDEKEDSIKTIISNIENSEKKEVKKEEPKIVTSLAVPLTTIKTDSTAAKPSVTKPEMSKTVEVKPDTTQGLVTQPAAISSAETKPAAAKIAEKKPLSTEEQTAIKPSVTKIEDSGSAANKALVTTSTVPKPEVKPVEASPSTPLSQPKEQEKDLPKKHIGPISKSDVPEKKYSYVLTAGIHGNKKSALAKLYTLNLLDIPSKVQAHEGRYMVVVGKYPTEEDAMKAAKIFAAKGHRFDIIIDR